MKKMIMISKIWKKSKIRPRLDKKEYKKKDCNWTEIELKLNWKWTEMELKLKKKKVQIENGPKSKKNVEKSMTEKKKSFLTA